MTLPQARRTSSLASAGAWRACAALALAACASSRSGDSRSADETELRAMHAEVLRAHRENALEPWLALEADPYVVANRGEITLPSAEERRAARAPYLARTSFSVYRDLREPLVEISHDGTLAWLICQVEGRGEQRDESGASKPIEFVYAWIELYRREQGRWRMVGNVSNQKPAP